MEFLQLHYYLKDQVHSMDAFVINKAEGELLKIFKEVSKLLELEDEISFEVIALEEGGLKAFYKFLNKKKTKKKINNILLFLGGIMAAVITNVISDKISEDEEYEELKKEELKLNIRKLKGELESDETNNDEKALIIKNFNLYIFESDKIKLFRSNFYSNLLNENRIEKISTQLLDEEKTPISKEKIVIKEDFKKFIVNSIEIESDYREGETIEIVAPVLKKEPLKWKGVYEGKSVNFNLKDNDFRNSVLKGEISFSSGIRIICDVELEQTMNDDGEITVKSINAYNVTDIIDGVQIFETKRKKREIEMKNQTKLDLDN